LKNFNQMPKIVTTGLNLLGIVKHALHTEVLYFGSTFGREWPTSEELVSSGDPQAEWYATASESAPHVIDLYRRVQAFADETIDALPLDAIGHVAHWRSGGHPSPRNGAHRR
jgi:hypothetical protein